MQLVLPRKHSRSRTEAQKHETVASDCVASRTNNLHVVLAAFKVHSASKQATMKVSIFSTHQSVKKHGISKRLRTKVKKLMQKIGNKRAVIKFLTLSRDMQRKLLQDMRRLKDLKDEETQQAKKAADEAKEEGKRIRQLVDGLLKDLELVEREADTNSEKYKTGVNEVSDMANKIDLLEECYSAQDTDDCLMYAGWEYAQIRGHIHLDNKSDILKLTGDDAYATVEALDSYGLKYNPGHELGNIDLHRQAGRGTEFWQKYLAQLLKIDWEEDTKRKAAEMLKDDSESPTDGPSMKKLKTDQSGCSSF